METRLAVLVQAGNQTRLARLCNVLVPCSQVALSHYAYILQSLFGFVLGVFHLILTVLYLCKAYESPGCNLLSEDFSLFVRCDRLPKP